MPDIRRLAQAVLTRHTASLAGPFEKGAKTSKEAVKNVGGMLREFQRDRNKDGLVSDEAWKEMLTDMGDVQAKLMRIELTLRTAVGGRA